MNITAMHKLSSVDLSIADTSQPWIEAIHVSFTNSPRTWPDLQ